MAKRGRPRLCPHDPLIQPEFFRVRVKQLQGGKYQTTWADCLECKRSIERARYRTRGVADRLADDKLRRAVKLLLSYAPGWDRDGTKWTQLIDTVEEMTGEKSVV